MADPRFYDNRGPFNLAALCTGLDVTLPKSADGDSPIFDIAGLDEAGPPHLTYFSGAGRRGPLNSTKAGWCLIAGGDAGTLPATTTPIVTDSAQLSFVSIARQFYPEHELIVEGQKDAIDPTARIGDDTVLSPGVVVGPGAEIGKGTRIGANTVIGRGVAIGRNCEIGSNADIRFSYLGDDVVVQSGARIGGSGFGFVSDPSGHTKIPQLGRVIVQDRVEVGANTAIDRGALSDTVIGEGTKIDNLVQIGHNAQIGRHCIIVAEVGISGSVRLGDFVVLGGGVGVADHLVIEEGARVAGMAGVMWNLSGGKTYCGHPARPIREFFREVATIAKLAKTRGKTRNG